MTNVNLWSYLIQWFSEWEEFRKSCRENQNTLFSLTFSKKNLSFMI